MDRTLMCKEVVQVAYRAFPHTHSFISEVVDLLRNTWIANTKYATFTSGQNVHWAWLQWVTRVMDLLGIVKTIMHCYWSTVWCGTYSLSNCH